jgi:hypothetical protein
MRLTVEKALLLLLAEIRSGDSYTIGELVPHVRYMTGREYLMDGTLSRKHRLLRQRGMINYKREGACKYVLTEIKQGPLPKLPAVEHNLLSSGDVGYLLYCSMFALKELQFGNTIRIYERVKHALPKHWSSLIVKLIEMYPYDSTTEVGEELREDIK